VTDTTTEPYTVTAGDDGRTWRRTCHLCPTSAVGDDETQVRRRAQDHHERAHTTTMPAADPAQVRADLALLHADATRALEALEYLIATTAGADVEVLGARHCLAQSLANTQRSLS
jgi:hypothetical protein